MCVCQYIHTYNTCTPPRSSPIQGVVVLLHSPLDLIIIMRMFRLLDLFCQPSQFVGISACHFIKLTKGLHNNSIHTYICEYILWYINKYIIYISHAYIPRYILYIRTYVHIQCTHGTTYVDVYTTHIHTHTSITCYVLLQVRFVELSWHPGIDTDSHQGTCM